MPLKVNQIVSLVFHFLSYFLFERDYLSRKEHESHEQNMLTKSMIDSMKNLKTDVVENPSAESTSSTFEALFKEHWAHIYRLLRRLVGDPAEAEDLALETFVRLYQKYPLPENDSNPGGWLHRVATNLGLHSIRSWKRRQGYELTAGKNALEESLEARPAEIMAQEEERRFVRLTLAQMKERQSQLLVMRYSGFSYQEIAEALRLAPTSIGPLLLRAEREFEKRYRTLAKEER
jgi:RNA polymerase sigma-70 factor (ECF subfamily)